MYLQLSKGPEKNDGAGGSLTVDVSTCSFPTSRWCGRTCRRQKPDMNSALFPGQRHVVRYSAAKLGSGSESHLLAVLGWWETGHASVPCGWAGRLWGQVAPMHLGPNSVSHLQYSYHTQGAFAQRENHRTDVVAPLLSGSGKRGGQLSVLFLGRFLVRNLPQTTGRCVNTSSLPVSKRSKRILSVPRQLEISVLPPLLTVTPLMPLTPGWKSMCFCHHCQTVRKSCPCFPGSL